MAEFTVELYEIHVRTLIVKARDSAEAIAKALKGLDADDGGAEFMEYSSLHGVELSPEIGNSLRKHGVTFEKRGGVAWVPSVRCVVRE